MLEDPTGELDAPFSSPAASATSWTEVDKALRAAEIFWLATVRPDGRPHTTPLIGAWLHGALYFTTGRGERKERNLRANANCVMTTGCNAFRNRLDVVVEGTAERITDERTLRAVAERFERKYAWRFEVVQDALREAGSPDPAAEPSGALSLVFGIAPVKILAFGRGDSFTATRFRL